MADPDDRSDDAPLEICGIPIRLDATLADPGEIWLEKPDGEVVRVWPPTPPEEPNG